MKVASSITNWWTSSRDSPDRKFLMKVTRRDTKVTEEPTKREESLVISDILLQLGVRKAEERETGERGRGATRSPRSIKASASAENFYMNGFHYVADLLRASSREALISSSQRVLLSSATIQAAVWHRNTPTHKHVIILTSARAWD